MNGRNKGARGEREIVELLSEWWHKDYHSAVFVRTPGSGGWGGASESHKVIKANMHAGGDIMTTNKKFPFSVEVKRRENWSYAGLLKANSSPIWAFWRQAVAQGKRDSRIPLLVFRKNRKGGRLKKDCLLPVQYEWLAMMPKEFANKLGLYLLSTWSSYALLSFDLGEVHPCLFKFEELRQRRPKDIVKEAWAGGSCDSWTYSKQR